ncbi:MAG: hypothetical protein MRZ66_01970, partial [Clostridiales bacterium]|nr:hypothetical protein [Clostridiales bacterium]
VYKNEKYTLAMGGDFQVYNAVTAIELANVIDKKGYRISNSDIINGLKSAKINGRLEYLNKNLVIDGAHNPQAIAALLKALSQTKRQIYFLTAVMQDKDYSEIVKLISDFAAKNNSEVVTTEVDMPRCLSCNELSNEFSKHSINSTAIKQSAAALKELTNRTSENPNALICVCGSLYLAGEIRRN